MTSNINVASINTLIPPIQLINKYPITSEIEANVKSWRQQISDIVNKKDKRMLAVVGPCSIHDIEAALTYAKELKHFAERYKEELFIVMRVYFEKPRTTIGWKGLINDPDLNDTFNIDKGLIIARQLLLKINTIGLPIGCEFLDVFTPQYYADLVSWGAIGARTVESQLHRQLASGLSMPIGFKNGTVGTIVIAADAVTSAKHSHVFIGIDINGSSSIVSTKGNQDVHIILRGSVDSPNYYPEKVEEACDILKSKNLNPSVMIDCSHGNSRKVHQNQEIVLDSICSQIGRKTCNIIGLMIESNINEGKQKLVDPDKLKWGVSITDSCISLLKTDILLNKLSLSLKKKHNSETMNTLDKNICSVERNETLTNL